MTQESSNNQVAKTVLIPLANGFEPIEAITLIDILRRANFEVDVASIHDKLDVLGAHAVSVKADKFLKECLPKKYDLIVLAGGYDGSINLSNCHELIEKLHENRAANRYFAALCAAPALVFAKHGLLKGYRATCYPSFELPPEVASPSATVVCRNCVTSQGPATAMEFALTLVRLLGGDELKNTIGGNLLAY